MTNMALHDLAKLGTRTQAIARFRPRSHAGGLDCWIAAPSDRPIVGAPIIAVHGICRQAHAQARLLGRRAVARGRMVVAPLFLATEWPRYQQAVARGRADMALLDLLADLASEGLPTGDRFVLTGFSGGAQFAHRFALFHPERIAQLVSVSAGWYSFPDDAPFPSGFGASKHPMTATIGDNIDAFLRIPIDICVGDRDRRRDRNLRSGLAIDNQQGRNRYERAVRWAEALQAAARSRRIEPDIEFHSLADCGHRFDRCVRRGGLDRIVLAMPGKVAIGVRKPAGQDAFWCVGAAA